VIFAEAVGMEIEILSGDQLNTIMRAVLKLPVEKRSMLLQRIADQLRLPNTFTYSESELDNAVRVAVRELIQKFACPPGTIRWLDRGWPRDR
jgi:predicted GTPase